MMKKTAFFIGIAFFVISCNKIIEITIPQSPPKLVVTCLFQKDSTFKMRLNKSTGILDDISPHINQAEIYLFENNTCIDTLVYNGENFESHKVAKTGKIYDFSAKATNLDAVTASNYTPTSPVLGNCSISDIFIPLDEEDILDQQVRIEIHDINPKDNYYEIVLLSKYIDPYSINEYHGSFYSFSTSPIIENENILSVYPESLVFSDELFNNDTGIIKLSYRKPHYTDENGSFDIDNYSLIIVLRSVSKSYYVYKKKLYQHIFNQENSAWSGIGEPTQMYSNIKGGYGIFAGYSEIRKEIVLPHD